MKTFIEIVRCALETGAREAFILAGQSVMYRTREGLIPDSTDPEKLTASHTEKLVRQALEIDSRPFSRLRTEGDDQFVISLPGLSRVSISAYRQRSSYAMTLRIIPFGIPTTESLHLPKEAAALADLREGLVLIGGPSGSGRSSTLACLLDRINHRRIAHILTIEDPIEYLFKNDLSFVSQREVSHDTRSVAEALGAAHRQSPDVIMISRLTGSETWMEAAELSASGRLVMTAVTARRASQIIPDILMRVEERYRDAFAHLLSRELRAVIWQQLTVTPDGLMPSCEFLELDEVCRTLIAEADTEKLLTLKSRPL